MLDLQGIQGFRGDVESEHLQMDCNKLLNRLGPNPILVPIFTVFLPWHSRVLVQERGAGWRQKCEELGSAHHEVQILIRVLESFASPMIHRWKSN